MYNNFTCIFCSSEDPLHPFCDVFKANTVGYISSANPNYPIESIVDLNGRFLLNGIELVSHESMIASRVDLFISSNEDSPTEWKNVGFFCFNRNDRSKWVARELKRIPLNMSNDNIFVTFVKLVFSGSHKTPGNVHNQISLISINFLGTFSYRPKMTSLSDMLVDLNNEKQQNISDENFIGADLVNSQLENANRNIDNLNELFRRKSIALNNEEFLVVDSINYQILSILNNKNINYNSGYKNMDNDNNKRINYNNNNNNNDNYNSNDKNDGNKENSIFVTEEKKIKQRMISPNVDEDKNSQKSNKKQSKSDNEIENENENGDENENDDKDEPEDEPDSKTENENDNEDAKSENEDAKSENEDENESENENENESEDESDEVEEKASKKGKSVSKNKKTPISATSPKKKTPSNQIIKNSKDDKEELKVDPLTDEVIQEAELLINYYGEDVIATVYSESWPLKVEGYQKLCSLIKNVDNSEKQIASLQGMVPLMTKLFSSNLKSVYVNSINQTISLIDEIINNCNDSKNVPHGMMSNVIRHLLPLTMNKLNDANSHINESALKFVKFSAKIDKLAMDEILRFSMKPPPAQNNFALILNKLDLLNTIAEEGEHSVANKLNIAEVMKVIVPNLESKKVEIRQKALELYVTFYCFYGTKMEKYIKDCPRLIKEQVYAAIGLKNVESSS